MLISGPNLHAGCQIEAARGAAISEQRDRDPRLADRPAQREQIAERSLERR